MEHEITIDKTRYRGEDRYRAICVTCVVGLHRASRLRSRAELVAAAHRYAVEIGLNGGRVVVDLPYRAASKQPVTGICYNHAGNSVCVCERDCARCTGCRCTCECYTCNVP